MFWFVRDGVYQLTSPKVSKGLLSLLGDPLITPPHVLRVEGLGFRASGETVCLLLVKGGCVGVGCRGTEETRLMCHDVQYLSREGIPISKVYGLGGLGFRV